MRDLLELIFRNLRGYVPTLASMVARPKTTIARRVTGEERDLSDALVFVGITVAIGFVFQAPALQPGEDFTMRAGAMAAYKIVIILLSAALIWAAFRILGGAGRYETTLAAYLYVISPLYLALVMLHFFAKGMQLALTDSGQSVPWDAIALVVMLGWGIACLGAFRSIHAVSRARAAVAFVLSVVAISLLFTFGAIVLLGLFGHKGPSIA